MQPVLRYGARGPAVELVQRRLKEAGFPPGRIDGLFGRATEAALVAFQRAGGLLADGVVGPVTWSRLAGLGAGSTDDLSARIDVAFVAEMFPATPLPSIRRQVLRYHSKQRLPGRAGVRSPRRIPARPPVRRPEPFAYP